MARVSKPVSSSLVRSRPAQGASAARAAPRRPPAAPPGPGQGRRSCADAARRCARRGPSAGRGRRCTRRARTPPRRQGAPPGRRPVPANASGTRTSSLSVHAQVLGLGAPEQLYGPVAGGGPPALSWRCRLILCVLAGPRQGNFGRLVGGAVVDHQRLPARSSSGRRSRPASPRGKARRYRRGRRRRRPARSIISSWSALAPGATSTGKGHKTRHSAGPGSHRDCRDRRWPGQGWPVG